MKIILQTKNVVFNITRTSGPEMIVLRHSGSHWSIDITQLYIKCPVGYNALTQNTSAYGVTNVGLRRSYLLDEVWVILLILTT